MVSSSETGFAPGLEQLLHGDFASAAQAEQTLLRALQLEPERSELAYALGLVVRERGDLAAAVLCFERCADLSPESVDVQRAFGQALAEVGQWERALGHLQAALALDPKSVDSCLRVAEVLHRLQRSSAAMAMARHVLEIDPRSVAGHVACAKVLAEERRFDAAIEAYSKALALAPEHAEAHDHLAHIYFRLGRIEEAIASYRRALAVSPGDAATHSALVYVAGFHPEWSQQQILAEARAWSTAHAEPLRASQQPHPHDPTVDRRLRLGYVSADFDNHCQRFFTLPLLRQHDHGQFEVVCYSSVRQPDEWTERVRAGADVWHDVSRLDDEALAERIRQDRVDVLIDLSMHMPKNRLRMFARKPAPVQICWLAYPGTTGLEAMDFRITDPYLDPPDAPAGQYSERPLVLPHSFWCYEPASAEPEVGPLPALANGRVTFGCLNDSCKVHRAVLESWARVLGRVPRSRLLLLAPQGSARRSVLEVMARAGVAAERIEFVDRLPHSEYLATYQRIDVALDCLPANGHTTSFDSLWMGVPVVTLVGKTVLGRAGWCQAQNLGLSELVAFTPERFVEIAVELTGDLGRLNELRRSLRARMLASPLMDAPGFARAFEGACRSAWRDWCERQGAAGTVS